MRKSAAWINGLLVETEDSYIRENPGTLEPLEKVFLCSKKEVENACKSAHGAFELWSNTPGNIRGNILFKIAGRSKSFKETLRRLGYVKKSSLIYDNKRTGK